ncbi:MAG: HAD-IA family hydrolase [Thermoanaerobaculia bacterium]|nr:HAD-IA family hydrolase [Thermoanaerobaculia bacterium]
MARLGGRPERDGPVDRHRRRAGDALKRTKAVFLDAGNTLLAADPPVEAVYGDAFRRWGLSADDSAVHDALRATWGHVAARQARGEERWGGGGGERAFWQDFVQDVWGRLGGGLLPEGLLDDLIVHFARQESWVLYPEVLEVLAALREKGLKLVVVSNWDSTLPALLDRLDLTRFFDGVVVSALVGASKPARAIFDTALDAAGVAPHEALHVGDSPSEDYEGARSAGLPALLLDRAGVAGDGYETIRTLQEILPRLAP